MRKRFKREEDEIIIKTIQENVYNLGEGFRKCAKILERSERSVTIRYYRVLRNKNPNQFVLIGRTNNTITNTKNIKTGDPIPTKLLITINGVIYNSTSISSINISF